MWYVFSRHVLLVIFLVIIIILINIIHWFQNVKQNILWWIRFPYFNELVVDRDE